MIRILRIRGLTEYEWIKNYQDLRIKKFSGYEMMSEEILKIIENNKNFRNTNPVNPIILKILIQNIK